jgi:acetyl-CoA carboxylase biotin carboxylase subunit
MQRALGECAITGVPTTIPFHQQILRHEAFLRGEVYTDFITQHLLPGQ